MRAMNGGQPFHCLGHLYSLSQQHDIISMISNFIPLHAVSSILSNLPRYPFRDHMSCCVTFSRTILVSPPDPGELGCRDHSKRPSAIDALQHPWLQTTLGDRGTGKPIDQAIVQRLQVTRA